MKQRKKRGRLSPAAENNLSDLFSGMTYAPAGTYGMGQAASLTVVRRSMLSSATNFNGSSHLVTVNFSYVMKKTKQCYMLSRILACTLTCLVSAFSYAQSLMSYVGCMPGSGEDIENFVFTLSFDLDDVIATYGEADYGIYIIGDPTYCTKLYEGEGDEKTLLGTALTNNINGISQDFKVGNTVQFEFSGIVVKPGVKYTLEIGNSFSAVQQGVSKPIKKTVCNFQENKLVYVYTGKAASANSLTLEGCSIINNSKLEVLSSVTYKFNAPISIIEGVQASLSLSDNVVSSSSSMEVNDDTNELTVKFDDVILYNQNTYTVTLPEGVVCLKDNESSVNKAFSFNVSGTNFNSFGIITSEPADNSTALTNTVQITFDLPTDYKLLTSMGDSSNFSASLYKDAVSEDNLVKGNVMGNPTSDGKGLEWSFGISPEPSTKYILYIPKFQFGAWKNGTVNDYANEEITLTFSTPSVAEAGLDPLVFEAPVLNEHGKGETLKANEKYASIGIIEIPLKDLNYYYNGIRQGLIINTPLYVYDITDGNENLVKECTILIQQRETTTFYYPVLRVSVSNNFFSGKKYKLSIPAGTISISNPLIQKYVTNTEWSFEFDGDTPLEVKLTDCTLENDAELSEISAVVWKFKGEFVQNPNLTVQLLIQKPHPLLPGSFLPTMSEAVTAASTLTGNTTLVGAFYDATNGGALQLDPKNKYQVILPEGLIYYAGDPSIKNERMTIDIIPVEKISGEPEFVNVEIVTNDFMTTTQKAVKGQSFTLVLTPEENWKVESVMQGEEALEPENGTYTTAPIEEDATLTPTLTYDGPWAVELESGVWEVPGSDIRIYPESGKIVIEGLTPDKVVNVYSVAGLLINSARADEGYDIVKISVAPGQVYIVTIDGVAAKIRM